MDLDLLKTIIEQLNLVQLIVIGAMFWFFYQRLTLKIEKVDQKFDSKFDYLDKKIDQKIDALDKKIDQKIDALDKKFDQKIDALDHKFTSLITEQFDQRVLKYDCFFVKSQSF